MNRLRNDRDPSAGAPALWRACRSYTSTAPLIFLPTIPGRPVGHGPNGAPVPRWKRASPQKKLRDKTWRSYNRIATAKTGRAKEVVAAGENLTPPSVIPDNQRNPLQLTVILGLRCKFHQSKASAVPRIAAWRVEPLEQGSRIHPPAGISRSRVTNCIEKISRPWILVFALFLLPRNPDGERPRVRSNQILADPWIIVFCAPPRV